MSKLLSPNQNNKRSKLDFSFKYHSKSNFKAKLHLSILSLFSLVFIACGGGGGSSSSVTNTKIEASIHDSAIQGLDYRAPLKIDKKSHNFQILKKS